MAQSSFVRRHLTLHSRFYLGAIAAAVAFATTSGARFELSVAAAADAFFAVYLIMLFVAAGRATPKSTMEHARTDDDGLLVIAALTFAAIAFSLFAIITLMTSHDHLGTADAVTTIVCVPLGWLTMHTSFATHYARQFYQEADGGKSREGLDFPGDEPPDLWDFLYFSLTLGMTAQTSDVEISGKPIRRLALVHSIVSYFYNAVIIALAVNVAVQSAGS